MEGIPGAQAYIESVSQMAEVSEEKTYTRICTLT